MAVNLAAQQVDRLAQAVLDAARCGARGVELRAAATPLVEAIGCGSAKWSVSIRHGRRWHELTLKLGKPSVIELGWGLRETGSPYAIAEVVSHNGNGTYDTVQMGPCGLSFAAALASVIPKFRQFHAVPVPSL